MCGFRELSLSASHAVELCLLMQNEVESSAVAQCGIELNKTNLHQNHNKLKITAPNKIISQCQILFDKWICHL
jgi:hypothetical protein